MEAHKLSNQVCSSIIFHPRSTMVKLHQTMFFTPSGPNGQDAVKSVDRLEEDDVSITNDVEKQYWKKQGHVIKAEVVEIEIIDKEAIKGKAEEIKFDPKMGNGNILCGKRSCRRNPEANWRKIMHFIQNGLDGQNAVIDARQPEPKSVILKRCVERNKL